MRLITFMLKASLFAAAVFAVAWGLTAHPQFRFDSAVRSFVQHLPGKTHRWAPAEGVALIALAALLIGFILGRLTRYRTHAFQSSGEARLSRALAKRFCAPDYHLLNHLTLRLGDGTTQVDHILVSRFGIFVIENKDYTGWIFANPHDRQWTQVLYTARFRFQNPIRQNYRHICAVRELLEFLPEDAVRSSVVFTGDAQFKTPTPEGVFSLPGFLAYLEGQLTEVMSTNRLQFCVGRLETARLSVTKTTDIEHVQALRRKYGNDE